MQYEKPAIESKLELEGSLGNHRPRGSRRVILQDT